MKMHRPGRTLLLRALAITIVLGASPAAFAQITPFDAGTDQLPPAVSSPPITTPLKLAPAPKPSTLGDGGDAVQLHATRVAALMSFSRSLQSACTAKSSDVDKGLLERASIRAIALRQGIADMEEREKRLRQESIQKPNDGRLRAEIATVVQQKRRILDAATKEVSGKVGDAARSIAALRSTLCTELCTPAEKSTSPVDMCAFASSGLAHAAVLADEASVRGVATYVHHRFDALRIQVSPKQSLSLADMAVAEPGISPIFAVGNAASQMLEEQHTGLDVAAFTMGALDVGLKAVATLIVDRAKRESIVWLARRLHEDVCGGSRSRGAPYSEIRTFWFPTTCALAGDSVDFIQYGDADLMRTIRGAIATDVSTWHNVALGLGLGATFWADAKIDAHLLTCEEAGAEDVSCTSSGADLVACEARRNKTRACGAMANVRLSGAKLARGLASGANASLALYNFAADVERINTYVRDASGMRRFFSPRLELMACAAAIPYIFQEYGDLIRQTRPGPNEESKALLLAALVDSPACFSLLGRGFSRQTCGGFSEATARAVDAMCTTVDPTKPLDPRFSPMEALQVSGKLEKLSTILRWAHLIEGPAADMSTRWVAVVDAFRAYRQAADDMTKAFSPNATPSPTFTLGDSTSPDKLAGAVHATTTFAENAARFAERAPKLRVAKASLVLARASMDLALAFLDATEHTLADAETASSTSLFGSWYEHDKQGAAPNSAKTMELLFPGLEPSAGISLSVVRQMFVDTRADIRRLSDSIDTLEAVFAEDWGRVVARVIAGMRRDIERSCSTATCKAACAQPGGPCSMVDTIAQYSGVFTALAFESDPDRVAAAIESAVFPGGGYRRKNVPGALTISLGSFAGMSGGTEFRFGTYNGRNESGKIAYLAAPTLTLPVGIDFARGCGSYNIGLFVSAIDPAGYLQYDVSAGGKLPGAQLVTALAPGAWLHASLFDSPFTFGVYGVFRPGLRADMSALSVPSAHALQFGVSAAVDVTLFDLFSSSASFKK